VSPPLGKGAAQQGEHQGDAGKPPHLGAQPEQGQERPGVVEPGAGERLDLGGVEGEQLQFPSTGDRRAVVADDPRGQQHPAAREPSGEVLDPLDQALAVVGLVGDRLTGPWDLDGDFVPRIKQHNRLADLKLPASEAAECLGWPRGQGLL
jgi:hypothetical protein